MPDLRKRTQFIQQLYEYRKKSRAFNAAERRLVTEVENNEEEEIDRVSVKGPEQKAQAWLP